MLGHLEAVEGRHRYIILIMKDKINVGDLPDDMQKYVKTRTYIDATNLEEMRDLELVQRKLLYSMPQTAIKDFNVEVRDENPADVPPLFHRMFTFRNHKRIREIPENEEEESDTDGRENETKEL